jgi:ribosomal protein S18 acetylase RimI-like enzyme
MIMISIRRARSDDYPAFAELFLQLGIDDPVPDQATWLEHFMPLTWVATLAGEVAAYCYVQAFDSIGHVQHVVVAPAARERGIGRALMETAAAWFRERRLTAWRLNVRMDNGAALALYTSLGFQRVHTNKLLRLPRNAVTSLRGGHAAVRALPVERDAATEARFDIPSGMITRLRTRGRLPFEAMGNTGDDCLGFALLDASQARARPFRAITLDAVVPLIDVLRRHTPSTPHLDLLIENHRELADVLEGAGAAVRLETSLMQAPL